MNGEELTEQETTLFDRQIRVWGVDVQRRLSKSHVLVSGLKGTAVEFCKNIVLAGVGSLTLNDDNPVTEQVLAANFFIPFNENMGGGGSLAELCCDSLKDFNPLVHVSVEKGDLSSFDVDFFEKFDVVVISCCSLADKKLVNEKCRKLSKRVAFYTVDCSDSCGEIFVDLQKYAYAKDDMKKSLDEYSSTSTPLSEYEILEKTLGVFHGHFPGIGRKLLGDGFSRVPFQAQSKMYTKEEVDRRLEKVVKRAEEAVGEVVETVNTKLSTVWGAFEKANILITNYTPVTTPIIMIDLEDDEDKEDEEDGDNE